MSKFRLAALAAPINDGEEKSLSQTTASFFRLQDWPEDDAALANEANQFFEEDIPNGADDSDGSLYDVLYTMSAINQNLMAYKQYYTGSISRVYTQLRDEGKSDVDTAMTNTANEMAETHHKSMEKLDAEKLDDINVVSLKAAASNKILLTRTDSGFDVAFSNGPFLDGSIRDNYGETSNQQYYLPSITNLKNTNIKNTSDPIGESKEYQRLVAESELVLRKIEKFFGITIDEHSLKTQHIVRKDATFKLSDLFPAVLNIESSARKSGFSRNQQRRCGDQITFDVVLHPAHELVRIGQKTKNTKIDAAITLSYLEISIRPVFSISTQLAEYLSQSTPPNISALYAWTKQWSYVFFESFAFKNLLPYIVPLSRAAEVTKSKVANKMHTQNTRADEDGFAVDYDGVVRFTPPSQENADLALRYEELVEQLLDISSKLGEPLSADRVTLDTDRLLAMTADPQLRGKIEHAKFCLSELCGLMRAPLVVNWDMDMVLSLQKNAEIGETNLLGSGKPRDSSIGGVLSRPINHALVRFTSGSSNEDGETVVSKDNIRSLSSLNEFSGMSGMVNTLAYLMYTGDMQPLDTYLKQGAAELSIDRVAEDSPENAILKSLNASSRGIFNLKGSFMVGHDGVTFGRDSSDGFELTDEQRETLNSTKIANLESIYMHSPLNGMKKVIKQPNDKLAFIWTEDEPGYEAEQWEKLLECKSQAQAFITTFAQIVDRLHPHAPWIDNCVQAYAKEHNLLRGSEEIQTYRDDLVEKYTFRQVVSSYEEMSSGKTFFEVLGRFVWGRGFSAMCRDLIKAARTSDLLKPKSKADSFLHNFSTFVPSYSSLSNEVLPMAYLFGKVMPRAAELVAIYEDSVSTRRKALSNAAELPTYATGKDFVVFPHQKDVLAVSASHPDVEIDDVAPGGGKCLVGSTRVVTDRGIFSLRDLWNLANPESETSEGFRILNFGVKSDLDNTFQATMVYRRTCNELVEVQLADGSDIRGLHEHKVMALNDGIAMTQIGDLTRGMWVPKVTGQRFGATELVRLKEIEVTDPSEALSAYLEMQKLPLVLTKSLATIAGLLNAKLLKITGTHVPEEIAEELTEAITQTFAPGFVVDDQIDASLLIWLHRSLGAEHYLSNISKLVMQSPVDVQEAFGEAFLLACDRLYGGIPASIDFVRDLRVLVENYSGRNVTIYYYGDILQLRYTDGVPELTAAKRLATALNLEGANIVLGYSRSNYQKLVEVAYQNLDITDQYREDYDTVCEVLRYHWTQVTSVAKVKCSGYVYDLSVPGPHTYVFDSFYGHNTVMNLLRAMDFIARKGLKRVGIICPNHLLINYANDLKMLSDHNWNFIPIVTETFNRWGEKRMRELIANAPPNTIIGIGMDWLSKANKATVQIESYQRTIYTSVEFLKQFEFDCLMVDEGHKLRKESQRNKCAMALMQDPNVKYRIHVTGTFIVDNINDVTAQTRLLDPMIFGSNDEFSITYSGKAGSYTSENIAKIRSELNTQAAYLRYTKNDWAFCLPNPNELHHFVTMNPEMQSVYQSILEETLQKIIEEAKTNPALKRLLTDLDAAEDSDEDIDLSSLLNPYLARLEQFLLDPMGDALGSKLDTVSPKTLKIIELLQEHIASDPNKVIVACSFKRSARIVYESLPPELKEIAVYYDADHKDAKEAFQRNPKVKILVAVQQSIIEGFNLQLASSLIRAEQLWSPGEVDQLDSRIFRPDVTNKFGRETITRHLVICDNSMEVTKVARLISKTMAKTAFDEYGSSNAAYSEFLQLPKIKLNLRNMQDLNKISDFADYYSQYRKFVGIRNAEFKQGRARAIAKAEREGRDSPFYAQKGGEIPETFKVVNTPALPGQDCADPLKHGYDPLLDFFYSDLGDSYRADPDKLEGMPVKTDFGMGTIAKVVVKTEVDEETGNEHVALRGVSVRYANVLDENNMRVVEKFTGSRLPLIYLATKVPAEHMPLYLTVRQDPMAISATGYADWAAETATKLAKTKSKPKDKEQEEVDEEKPRSKKKVSAFEEPEPVEEQEDKAVSLHFATINGLPAVYAVSEDPDVDVIQYEKGFSSQGSYVFALTANLAAYVETINWLNSKFSIPPANFDYLQEFEELFTVGRNKRFDASLLGNIAKLREVFQINHKKLTKPDALAVYPLVENGDLYLMIDFESCPASRKLIGKKAPKAPSSAIFDKSDPYFVWVLPPEGKRSQIVSFIKAIRAAGLTISNEEEARENFRNFKF